MALSASTIILDTSKITYSLAATVTALNEGQSVTFTLTTTASNGTSIPYVISGIDATDLEPIDTALTGNFVAGSSTTLTLTLRSDRKTEGTETLLMTLTGTGVSRSVTIQDTSIDPPPSPPTIVSIQPNRTEVNETTSRTVTFSYSFSNRLSRKIYWKVNGLTATTTAADFTTLGGELNSDSGTFDVTVSTDLVDEDAAERFNVQFFLGSDYTQYFGEYAGSINIVDTSRTVLSTFQAITRQGLVSGTAASAFTPVTATGGKTPYTFSISPALPTGLSMSTSTGTITGTPSSTYALTTHTITVTDALGSTSSKTFQLIVEAATVTATYTITPSSTSIMKGQFVSFRIDCTGVAAGTTLYWSNNGTTNADDFNDGLTSGSFTVNSIDGNIRGFVFLYTKVDTVTSNETIIFNVRTGSVSGTIRATVTVTVRPPEPFYGITTDKNIVNEGDTLRFNINTLYVPVGTVIKWDTFLGTAGAADFTDGIASGTLTVGTLDIGGGWFTTIEKTLRNDSLTEGDENIILRLRSSTDSFLTQLAVPVIVKDTSLSAPPETTYGISTESYVMDEGTTVNFLIRIKNGQTGSRIYWNNIGTTNADDFTDGVNSGSFVVTSSDFSTTVSRTLKLDATTENTNETIQLELRTGAASGASSTAVGKIAQAVVVTDKSQTPAITYAVTCNVKGSVNEGAAITWTLTYNAVPVIPTGRIHFRIVGNVVAADFTQKSLFANFAPTTARKNTVTFNLANDLTTEGPESFYGEFNTTSWFDPVYTIKTTDTLTINDTSITPSPIYSISSSSSVNEGSSLTISVSAKNVPNGTQLSWSTEGGNIGAADFTDGLLKGTAIVQNQSAKIIRTLVADATTEGTESIPFKLFDNTGKLVATRNITVSDTSKTPLPTYSIVPNITSGNESSTIIYTITTTRIDNGTVLYWRNIGTTTAADFEDGLMAGTVTINNNAATITRQLKADRIRDGTSGRFTRSETVGLRLMTGSTTGPVVTGGIARSVTIADTSIA